MNLIQKIKLANKIKKAYKASKKLIDEKQGLAEEVKKAILTLQADLCIIAQLLPDFKEVIEEEKKIIEKCFGTGKKE